MANDTKILKVNLLDKDEVVLVFKGSNAVTLAARMQLHNVYLNHVAFRILSSNPIEYLITPSSGTMNPESFKDIKVIYQPTTEKKNSFFVHKLTIQYKILENSELNINPLTILEGTGEILRETKVKCYFYADDTEPKLLMKTTDPEFRFEDTADLNEVLKQIKEGSKNNNFNCFDFPSDVKKSEEIVIPYVEEPREPSRFKSRKVESHQITVREVHTRSQAKSVHGRSESNQGVKASHVKTYTNLADAPASDLRSRTTFSGAYSKAPSMKSRAQFTPESGCMGNSRRALPGQSGYGRNKSPICRTREHCGKPPHLDENVIKQAIQCYMRNKFGVDAFDTKPLNEDVDEEEIDQMVRRKDFGRLLNEDDINKIAECIRKVNEAKFSTKGRDLYEMDNLCYHRAEPIVTHKDLDSLRDKLNRARTLAMLLALLCIILALIDILLMKILFNEVNDKNVLELYF